MTSGLPDLSDHVPALFHALRTASAWAAQAGCEACVVAAAVLLVQRLLGRRISARWRYNLWLLVALRLVLPAVPGLSISPFNLLPDYHRVRTIASRIGHRSTAEQAVPGAHAAAGGTAPTADAGTGRRIGDLTQLAPDQQTPAGNDVRGDPGAMAKGTRLPVEPVSNPLDRGQAMTLAHGTHSANLGNEPVLNPDATAYSDTSSPAGNDFRDDPGAMGKRTRLPVEPVSNPLGHGQAMTLAHGTRAATLSNGPVLNQHPDATVPTAPRPPRPAPQYSDDVARRTGVDLGGRGAGVGRPARLGQHAAFQWRRHDSPPSTTPLCCACWTIAATSWA